MLAPYAGVARPVRALGARHEARKQVMALQEWIERLLATATVLGGYPPAAPPGVVHGSAQATSAV